jgi:hypothetical protein
MTRPQAVSADPAGSPLRVLGRGDSRELATAVVRDLVRGRAQRDVREVSGEDTSRKPLVWRASSATRRPGVLVRTRPSRQKASANTALAAPGRRGCGTACLAFAVGRLDGAVLRFELREA